ncbi:hypothetical protein L484_005332 [Morus notabilis]|uniref:Cullin N-terminal domain-containing protein n=1 Tax=Morus notabilis TaxID=981085 RepID=W9QUV0_9ROSA|nr:hypothetical protein L484_005332 [Morus notabilis]
MGSKPISFDEKWAEIYKVMMLKRIIEGLPDLTISSEEYMTVHTCVYDICTGSPPCDANIERLYNKYREVYEEYIASTVLPSLREKHGEFLLRELVKRRENHKVMTRWLSRLFHYLNPAYVKQRIVPTPHEVGGLSALGTRCMQS